MGLLLGVCSGAVCSGLLTEYYRRTIGQSVQDLKIAMTVNTGIGLFVLFLFS